MAYLVAGLGNPGPRYELTRHNAGFLVVDHVAEELRVSYWRDEAGARVASGCLGDEDVVLAKPQSFMNVSGAAVSRLVAALGVPLERLVVVHDDIDLPEGVVRVKLGGGHGGHNGLRSLHERLGSGGYVRVRIGVGRPPGRQDPADYVLEQLSRAATETLGSSVLLGAQAVLHVLGHGVGSAMNEFNRPDAGADVVAGDGTG